MGFRQTVVAVVLCASAAFAEGWLFTKRSPEAMAARAEASFAVLEGTPHWRAYQNRLLGPQLVRGIQVITDADDATSFTAFMWLGTFAKTFALYLLFVWLTGRRILAAFYATAGSLISILCYSYWIYPWDYLDAIFMTALLFCIHSGAGVKTLIALFALGLWNRETALYIPLWLAINGQFAAAAMLFAAGAAVVYGLRETLFVRSGISDEGLDLRHGALGNHVALFRNVREFFVELATLGRGPAGRARLFFGVFVALAGLGFARLRRLPQPGQRLMIWSVCVVLLVITFGAIAEARIWIGVIPLFLYWTATFAGHVRTQAAFQQAGAPPQRHAARG